MATTVDDVISKTRMVEIGPKSVSDPKSKEEEMGNEPEPMRSINDAEKEKVAAQQDKDAEETQNPKDKKPTKERNLNARRKKSTKCQLRLNQRQGFFSN